MLERIRDFLNTLIYGGTSGFNIGENIILDAVYDELPESEKRIFKLQRESVKLVQRQHPGKLIMAYYGSNNNVNPLPYLGYEHCLAAVKYEFGNQKKTTNVVLHEGVLQSIERNVPKDSTDIEKIISVKLHPKKYKDIATELDAEEHGGNA